MNCERQIEITPEEAHVIIRALNRWTNQAISRKSWDIAQSINRKVQSIADTTRETRQEEGDD